ncbi:MAG: neutral zinc metallopeptidase [Actinobacteria bacterium]|nr:neutral zinc metallopeptidase [Actinomycetota bacterium]
MGAEEVVRISGSSTGRRLVVLLSAALALLAGCSTSGSGTTSPTTSTAGTSASGPSASASSGAPIDDGDAATLPTFPEATAPPRLPSQVSTAQTQQFLTSVFDDVQRQWQSVFAGARRAYTPARLVHYSTAVRTACGDETADVGPFYCPADHTVYLDASFFTLLERQHGVSGDFALAYVVAHEVGHHVQTLTGVSHQVAVASSAQPAVANQLSVLTELQADCYAGLWAHTTYQRSLLEPGDIEQALTAAAAVGDDYLQHTATGTVDPEQWTHGSSAQRQHWFTVGYQSGQPGSCDTFTAAR